MTPSEHNHPASTAKTEARRIVNAIREKARGTQEKTASIVAGAVAAASRAAANVLPNIDRLARTVQRHRQQYNPHPRVPKLLEELVLEPVCCRTKKGENFLIKDAGGPDRYLIFGTQENLDILERCTEWFADGKFFTAKSLFLQLYTIHGKFDDIIVPLVYVFLPSKSKEIYREVLFVLKQLRPGMDPRSVMVDFETAFLLACKEVFPNVRVKGCYFHFCQAISRRIRESKLKSLYRNDSELTQAIRKICALVFVPPKDVLSCFQKLKKSKYFRDNMEILSEVIEYMERTWIGTPKRRNGEQEAPIFDIEMWNHYSSVIDDQPRTNNNVEGFYRRLSSRSLKDNPTFWMFLDLIITEQGVMELRVEQSIGGRAPAKKRKKWQDYDQRLKTVVESYNVQNGLKYLSRVAQMITL